MKVIITGCARSGTTMMIHLMRYFYSTNVIVDDEAHPFDYESYNHKDHVLVIKKPFLQRNHIGYFSIEYLIKNGWLIIWMLRDGRDVICSRLIDQFHVEPDRWIESNSKILNYYARKQILIVRYEDLVEDTECEMLRTGTFINQEFSNNYTEWWLNVNKETPMNTGMTPRPTSTESIGNFKNYPERVELAMANTYFRKLISIFGYKNKTNQ